MMSFLMLVCSAVACGGEVGDGHFMSRFGQVEPSECELACCIYVYVCLCELE